MYYNFHYYLLDDISGTIIGQFYARSERMARKILEGFDFKKANLDKSDVSLFCDTRNVPQFESYSEVVDCETCHIVDLIEQDVLDLENI